MDSILRARHTGRVAWFVVCSLIVLLGACDAPATPTLSVETLPSITASTALVPSLTPEPSATNTNTPTWTPAPTATASATATVTPTPTQTRVPHLVAVDAGHGGEDLGTRHFDADGHMDVHESEINLALALRLRDILVERGYRVLLTRDGDYRVNADELDLIADGEVTSADEVQARVDVINAAGVELLLSIHQNAYWPGGVADQSVGGPSTYYCADRPFGDENLRFAQLVQQHVVQTIRGLGYDADDRGVEDDLAIQVPGNPGTHLILLGPVSERIVRASEMPGALSETLFLSNDREVELLVDPEVQQAIAAGYADAIDTYFAGEQSPEVVD